MYCKECGSKIESGKFCPNCGIETVNSSNDEVDVSEMGTKNGITLKERYWLEAYRDNFASTRETIKRKGIKIDKDYKFNTGARNPSKIIEAVLAILLGNVGLHRFYLGYYVYGVLYLAATIILAVLGLDKLIIGIYALGLLDTYRVVTNKLKNIDGKEVK